MIDTPGGEPPGQPLSGLEKCQEELLPCPFCGGKASVGSVLESGSASMKWIVQCDPLAEGSCWVELKGWSKEEAIASWNRRAPVPAPASSAPALPLDRPDRAGPYWWRLGEYRPWEVVYETATSLREMERFPKSARGQWLGPIPTPDELLAGATIAAPPAQHQADLDAARAEIERLTRERDALLNHVVRELPTVRDDDGEWSYVDAEDDWIATWEPDPETERWVALTETLDRQGGAACWQPFRSRESCVAAVRLAAGLDPHHDSSPAPPDAKGERP